MHGAIAWCNNKVNDLWEIFTPHQATKKVGTFKVSDQSAQATKNMVTTLESVYLLRHAA